MEPPQLAVVPLPGQIPTNYRADRSIHSEGARGFAYGYQTETTGFFWSLSPRRRRHTTPEKTRATSAPVAAGGTVEFRHGTG